MMGKPFRDGLHQVLQLLLRPLSCFLLLLLLHGAFVVVAGVRSGSDTPKYVQWSDRLISLGFDYIAYLRGFSYSVPPVTYVSFVTLVAGCRMIAGEHWGTLLVLINLLCTSAAGALLVRQLFERTGSRLAAFAALLFYAAAFDIFNWARYVLSDIVFFFVAFMCLVLLLRPSGSSRDRSLPSVAAAVVMILLALTVRPVGFLLLALIPAKMYLEYRRRRPHFLRDAAVVSVGAALLMATALVHAHFAQNPSEWPFEALKRSVEYDAMIYARGEVVNARLETYHARPESLGDYLAITGDRALHYFAFTAEDFSALHSVVSGAFYLPLYVGAIAALLSLLHPRTRARMSEEHRDAMLLHLWMIVLFTVFHALVQVDFDWRYRLPIMPSLIFLAASAVAVGRAKVSRTGASGELEIVSSTP